DRHAAPPRKPQPRTPATTGSHAAPTVSGRRRRGPRPPARAPPPPARAAAAGRRTARRRPVLRLRELARVAAAHGRGRAVRPLAAHRAAEPGRRRRTAASGLR